MGSTAATLPTVKLAATIAVLKSAIANGTLKYYLEV
jgi:hypothetical protein